MTRSLPLLVAVLMAGLTLSGCSQSESDLIPPGTWTGSTSDDREFTIEVGEDIEVNRREARYTEPGVLEVEEKAARTTILCEVAEDEEELSCDVTTQVGQQPPTTEVVDLMLL